MRLFWGFDSFVEMVLYPTIERGRLNGDLEKQHNIFRE